MSKKAWLRLSLWVMLSVAAPAVLAQQAASSQPGDGLTAQQRQALNQIIALHWQKAGTTVPIASVANFTVPDGYGMLAPPDAHTFMELNQDLAAKDVYVLMPASTVWFAVLKYQNTGYVKDDEQLNADQLLGEMVNQSQEANKIRKTRGWAAITVQGWAFKPEYNKQIHRLEWAFLDRDEATHENVVNYNTRILGRGGVMDVELVSAPDKLQQSVAQLNTALHNFSYDPGQHYSEFRQGDRVAEFGLGALIVGGAAAVAAHKGVFAGLLAAMAAAWKLVAAAAVAVTAGIGRFFRRLGFKKRE